VSKEREVSVTPEELAEFFTWMEQEHGPETLLELPDMDKDVLRHYLREYQNKAGSKPGYTRTVRAGSTWKCWVMDNLVLTCFVVSKEGDNVRFRLMEETEDRVLSLDKFLRSWMTENEWESLNAQPLE
jgi:hypothetical protein